ncbi:hypothetical protein SDC9_112141 [bioreactor metagenome]|uniref:Uncharacterized protein n=1 Tax=bioreactor metagenome TaxID=1076179 RepID=A0A645BJ75_9ZZZZ
MPVAGGQIYKPPLGQHVEGAPVGQVEALDSLPAQAAGYRHAPQGRHVHLAVEMPRVAQNGVVLHEGEVGGGNHVPAAGDGDEHVSQGGGIVHLHHAEAVHGGVQCLEGIDLRDDDLSAHARGPHGHALAAPAVTGHHHGLARDNEVGGVHHGVPDRLAGAVFIVVVVLGLGVVDSYHGAGEKTRLLPGAQAEDARGGFLAAADEPVCIAGAFVAQQVDEVPAVVHHQIGAAFEGFDQVGLILLRRRAVQAEGLHTHAGKARGHVVLGGQGVGAGEIHLGSSRLEHQAEVGGFGLQMYGHGDGKPLEGALGGKAPLDFRKGGHMLSHPFDFTPAGWGKPLVLHNTHGKTPYPIILISLQYFTKKEKKAPFEKEPSG